jgi:hypothetical protein
MKSKCETISSPIGLEIYDGSHGPHVAASDAADCRLSSRWPHGSSKALGSSRWRRLSFRRIVFDAGYFDEQAELAKTLKASGCEIVLDPNFAESRPAVAAAPARELMSHELDRYFKEEQLQAIFNAKGGRSRFGCNDTKCCPHGGEDMIESGHVHFLPQRHRQLDELSSVPEARRAEHFLLRHLDPAIRSARYAARRFQTKKFRRL